MEQIIKAVLVSSVLAWGVSAAAPGAGGKPAYAEIKREIQVFENIINTSLSQVVPHPMFISDKARGTFLEGYGEVFSLSVNLNRGYVLFSAQPAGSASEKSVREQNARTVAVVKNSLVQILWQYGNSLISLQQDHKISIIAHVLNRTFEDRTPSNRVLVLTVVVRDLALVQTGKVSMEDFKRKVQTVEY